MKNNKFFLLIFLIFIMGCASIDKNTAEQKAIGFVNKNVRFFAKEQNSTLDLMQYKIDSMSSYQENNEWVVAMHISSQLGNETKKNDLIVRMDNKGNVLELNGKKVPR